MIANPQSIHRYSLRVYYEDTDAGGVVYHANYLRYAERARTEALRDAGIPHAELVERFGLMFMVHRAEIDYVRPAMLDDLLVVETETMEVGGATVLIAPDGARPGRDLRDAAHQARLRPNREKQAGPHSAPMARGDARPASSRQRQRTMRDDAVDDALRNDMGTDTQEGIRQWIGQWMR